MTIIIPPPLVEKFQYQACKQINDPITKKRVYLTPDGEHLPSVTTILSATKDTTYLNEWRKNIGYEKAQEITTTAANRGTAMHSNLERFIKGKQRQPGNNPIHVIANSMADVIIENGLSKVKEIWSFEQSLYYPGLYSGTTDGVGIYEDDPVIFDFKQSNKSKKEEWIEDYKMQVVAYALAHNTVYETNIRRGIIFICTKDLQFQKFEVAPKDFSYWEDRWLSKVEEYYNGKFDK